MAVEPPAGISQSETLRKVKAALYYPSLISIVVYGLRFLPVFTRLRQAIVDQNLIGPVSLCDVQITAPRSVQVPAVESSFHPKTENLGEVIFLSL